jgi:hypothetical protein
VRHAWWNFAAFVLVVPFATAQPELRPCDGLNGSLAQLDGGAGWRCLPIPGTARVWDAGPSSDLQKLSLSLPPTGDEVEIRDAQMGVLAMFSSGDQGFSGGIQLPAIMKSLGLDAAALPLVPDISGGVDAAQLRATNVAVSDLRLRFVRNADARFARGYTERRTGCSDARQEIRDLCSLKEKDAMVVDRVLEGRVRLTVASVETLKAHATAGWKLAGADGNSEGLEASSFSLEMEKPLIFAVHRMPVREHLSSAFCSQSICGVDPRFSVEIDKKTGLVSFSAKEEVSLWLTSDGPIYFLRLNSDGLPDNPWWIDDAFRKTSDEERHSLIAGPNKGSEHWRIIEPFAREKFTIKKGFSSLRFWPMCLELQMRSLNRDDGRRWEAYSLKPVLGDNGQDAVVRTYCVDQRGAVEISAELILQGPAD